MRYRITSHRNVGPTGRPSRAARPRCVPDSSLSSPKLEALITKLCRNWLMGKETIERDAWRDDARQSEPKHKECRETSPCLVSETTKRRHFHIAFQNEGLGQSFCPADLRFHRRALTSILGKKTVDRSEASCGEQVFPFRPKEW